MGIDASQHGLGTLEDLIVQADANAGQVLLTLMAPACRVAA